MNTTALQQASQVVEVQGAPSASARSDGDFRASFAASVTSSESQTAKPSIAGGVTDSSFGSVNGRQSGKEAAVVGPSTKGSPGTDSSGTSSLVLKNASANHQANRSDREALRVPSALLRTATNFIVLQDVAPSADASVAVVIDAADETAKTTGTFLTQMKTQIQTAIAGASQTGASLKSPSGLANTLEGTVRSVALNAGHPTKIDAPATVAHDGAVRPQRQTRSAQKDLTTFGPGLDRSGLQDTSSLNAVLSSARLPPNFSLPAAVGPFEGIGAAITSASGLAAATLLTNLPPSILPTTGGLSSVERIDGTGVQTGLADSTKSFAATSFGSTPTSVNNGAPISVRETSAVSAKVNQSANSREYSAWDQSAGPLLIDAPFSAPSGSVTTQGLGSQNSTALHQDQIKSAKSGRVTPEGSPGAAIVPQPIIGSTDAPAIDGLRVKPLRSEQSGPDLSGTINIPQIASTFGRPDAVSEARPVAKQLPLRIGQLGFETAIAPSKTVATGPGPIVSLGAGTRAGTGTHRAGSSQAEDAVFTSQPISQQALSVSEDQRSQNPASGRLSLPGSEVSAAPVLAAQQAGRAKLADDTTAIPADHRSSTPQNLSIGSTNSSDGVSPAQNKLDATSTAVTNVNASTLHSPTNTEVSPNHSAQAAADTLTSTSDPGLSGVGHLPESTAITSRPLELANGQSQTKELQTRESQPWESRAAESLTGDLRHQESQFGQSHRTLLATPTALEVGVNSGTQGWVRIRAEVGVQGEVNTSLVAASSGGRDLLHSQMPALNAFLHSEQIAATATVIDRVPLASAGHGTADLGLDGSASQSAAGGSDGSNGSNGSNGPNASNGLNASNGSLLQDSGGQTDSRSGAQSDQGQRYGGLPLRSSAVGTGYDSRSGIVDQTGLVSGRISISEESGRWLNIRV